MKYNKFDIIKTYNNRTGMIAENVSNKDSNANVLLDDNLKIENINFSDIKKFTKKNPKYDSIKVLRNVKLTTDKKWIELGRVEDKYAKTFNNLFDYTSVFQDEEEITRRLNKCVKLGIPYSKLYSEYENYEDIDI